MCSKKRHRNSSTAGGNNFCLLWSAQGDLAIDKGDQAMIGDGHAMGVAAKVLQLLTAAQHAFFCCLVSFLGLVWAAAVAVATK
jgi:hypothetical protein